MNSIRHAFTAPAAIAFLCFAGASARAQTMGPNFAADYTTMLLPAVPGVPAGYGGAVFKAGSPNTLLVIGATATSGAAIYEIGVTRDAAGFVDGFTGTAAIYAAAPFADGGLRYAPNGVLLYTTWPSNTLGQIIPGSAAANRIVDLTPLGVGSSTGGVEVTPSGFPGAGKLRITSYSTSQWYSADLVPDGAGTYDVANVALISSVLHSGSAGFPEAILYVDSNRPGFTAQSVLVCNWSAGDVGAYGIDAAGDIDTSNRTDFVDSHRCSGSCVDPTSGAYLFPAYTGSSVLVVKPNSGGTLGSSYCSPAVANSTGAPGVLHATGSSVVTQNDVTLTASDLPSNAFGFFLASRTQGLTMNPGGSQGHLCLAGGIGRYVGPGQIQNSGAAGEIVLVLDLNLTPTPMGLAPIVAGETWNFQAWHRDLISGVATSNFTDAVSIGFQ